jgi:hypothetical protein
LHCGWGADHLACNFSQFLEAGQDIHTRILGYDNPAKHEAGYIFDLLTTLESSIDNIDDVVEFVPFKLVSNLSGESVLKTYPSARKG